MAQDIPNSVRFVRSGKGHSWWATNKANGQLHGGYDDVPLGLKLSRDWEAIESTCRRENPKTWKQKFTALRTLIDHPSQHVWITFEEDSLWWCTVHDEIDGDPDGSSAKFGQFWLTCDRPWSDYSLGGLRHLAELPESVTKVAKYRATVCAPKNQDEILRVIRGDVADTVFAFTTEDPVSLEDARRRIEAAIVARAGAGAFRSQTLNAYRHRCAISDCDLNDALEAAHIVPYRGPHTNTLANAILLRADLHTLFDLGRFTIDPDTLLVSITERLRGTSYAWLDGRSVRVPDGVSRSAFSANLRQALSIG